MPCVRFSVHLRTCGILASSRCTLNQSFWQWMYNLDAPRTSHREAQDPHPAASLARDYHAHVDMSTQPDDLPLACSRNDAYRGEPAERSYPPMSSGSALATDILSHDFPEICTLALPD